MSSCWQMSCLTVILTGLGMTSPHSRRTILWALIHVIHCLMMLFIVVFPLTKFAGNWSPSGIIWLQQALCCVLWSYSIVLLSHRVVVQSVLKAPGVHESWFLRLQLTLGLGSILVFGGLYLWEWHQLRLDGVVAACLWISSVIPILLSCLFAIHSTLAMLLLHKTSSDMKRENNVKNVTGLELFQSAPLKTTMLSLIAAFAPCIIPMGIMAISRLVDIGLHWWWGQRKLLPQIGIESISLLAIIFSFGYCFVTWLSLAMRVATPAEFSGKTLEEIYLLANNVDELQDDDQV